VSHAPASKIYSRVREDHALACGGRKNMLLKTARSEGTHEHCGGAHLRLSLPKNDKSNFKKSNPKSSERMHIRGRGRQRGAEAELMVLLNKDKADKTSKEANMTSKEANKASRGAKLASKEA
jgi:hypothetical protein